MEKSIGKFISELRKQKDMTQKELADKLFVSDKTVSRWESGKCTPDLNLIPTIADIFEVSIEELLRGERIPAPSKSENLDISATNIPVSNFTETKDNFPTSNHHEKSEKQFKRLLQNKYTKFKNLSLISFGIFIIGLFAAIICNFIFYRATLGFCLAVLFALAIVICQICFTNSAIFHADDEENDLLDIISTYNSNIIKTSIKVYLCMICVFGLPLPFVIAPAFTGLTFASWIGIALVCCFVLFILSTFVYKTFIERSFVKKGLIILTESEENKNARRKKFFKTCGIPCGVVALVLLIGIFVVSSVLSVYTFFKPLTFDNYDDFKAYMALDVSSDFYIETDVEIKVEIFPDLNEPSKDDPEDNVENPTIYYLFNAKDEIICEYVWNNKDVYRIDINGKSEDGLPIKVYTYRDKYDGYDTQATIKGILTAAFAADCLVFIILYAIKMKKGV